MEQMSDLDKLVLNVNENFQALFKSAQNALPQSRQLSLSMTKLEEAWMWFDNAARVHKAHQLAQEQAHDEHKEEEIDAKQEAEEKVGAA